MIRNFLIKKQLFKTRFEIFFATLIIILFGSLFVPFEFYDAYLLPILLLINMVAGINVVTESKRLSNFFTVLLCLATINFVFDIFHFTSNIPKIVMYFVHFLFYVFISFSIIRQIWLTRCVNQNLIFGLMCGYISLGMLGFLIFSGIEILSPDSFYNTVLESNLSMGGENPTSMIYFSFITLLTIGYGDIIPISEAAQKATMLVGLMGQFYLVIITGVVVGKYINEKHTK